MTESRDNPGLLRFVLERLDDEETIILHTPLPGERHMDRDFVDQFVGRRALIERAQGDREVIAACVESMQRVQGVPRVATPVDPADEATVLGSEIIKLVANRFAGHPDFQLSWLPG